MANHRFTADQKRVLEALYRAPGHHLATSQLKELLPDIDAAKVLTQLHAKRDPFLLELFIDDGTDDDFALTEEGIDTALKFAARQAVKRLMQSTPR